LSDLRRLPRPLLAELLLERPSRGFPEVCEERGAVEGGEVEPDEAEDDPVELRASLNGTQLIPMKLLNKTR
jgi:hypothetical protein